MTRTKVHSVGRERLHTCSEWIIVSATQNSYSTNPSRPNSAYGETGFRGRSEQPSNILIFHTSSLQAPAIGLARSEMERVLFGVCLQVLSRKFLAMRTLQNKFVGQP